MWFSAFACASPGAHYADADLVAAATAAKSAKRTNRQALRAAENKDTTDNCARSIVDQCVVAVNASVRFGLFADNCAGRSCEV